MILAAPTLLSADRIAGLAVTALHDEIDLTPKPGLVDRRGPGAHDDMTSAMLHDSADALYAAFRECAEAAHQLPLGADLRARIGRIGRLGERAMLTVTNGVNTHRGALWALGLLSAAVATGARDIPDILATAARLARIPDPTPEAGMGTSHGALVQRRFGVTGALGQAQAGFPDITAHGLPALRRGQPLDALVALIAHVDDTCLLYRGGAQGLAAVQGAARNIMDAGGPTSIEGSRHFAQLDLLCSVHRLSPGGAGDLLAASMFLDGLDRERVAPCRP